MDDQTRKEISKILIHHIKSTYKKTYREIAKSVDVHESYIGKMAKGERIAQKVVDDLCKEWDINYGYLLEIVGVSSLEKKFNVSNAIHDILRLKGTNLVELSKESKLPFKDLVALKRGQREATDQEIMILSELLEAEESLLDEGMISSALFIIKEQMERLKLSDETKELIGHLINEDIKKPLTRL